MRNSFICFALAAKNRPEYRAHNPIGLVPTLETEVGPLFQSLAIIGWLEETHPTPRLLPADALNRARVRAFALTIACEIHLLNNLRVLRYLKHELAQGNAARDAWYDHWAAEGLRPCAEPRRRRSRFRPSAIPGRNADRMPG